ncbi:formamidopyrimidine-DNA glycosylase [Nocardioides luteus]|uniref:Formamidopyrimidine-DNA glycosylase n=1 Tax=Nocardioides luteus TaxID=1844 RepID=A0ABQ5STH3_9ACTN|nr:Fpg/Nei family DNA glycosylase [Nocardioides luteus]MDR7309781.1 formamidopyrimidine-DNA glycosylase [Nocardioides luteus]GGR61449.1 formamidopyrimidine-DNA glycosylase [Nocardioides luteus]GLJ67310.1 formamidopyrimidine-DNA glycosylase [Nocardioides luteus]
MPELPEVEVVRAGLERHVLGSRILAVEVLHPRPVRRHLAGSSAFAEELAGRVITGARRRGKYLWLPLDSGDALMAHLGMSGQMLVQPPTSPDERHLRVRLSLLVEPGERQRAGVETNTVGSSATGDRVGLDTPPPGSSGGSTDGMMELRFVDQRMFGGLSISPGGAELPPEIAHIAPDPLEDAFDPEAVVARIRRSASGIKRILLNQTVISGVGNIYADEALWRAKLHGERPGDRLSRPKVRELLGHVREVMLEALGQGGTSFDALYVNVNGQSGYFERSLAAYGREGEPCDRCGTPIRRVAFMNRSSFFCPKCQPAPRNRRSPAR